MLHNTFINIKLEETLEEIRLLKKIIIGKVTTGIFLIYELSIIINIYKQNCISVNIDVIVYL